MGRLKKLITSPRIIILVVVLLLSIWMISPSFSEGVAIRGVIKDSAAAEAFPSPFTQPASTLKPTAREVIKVVNGKQITTIQDYYAATSNLEINQTINIETSKGSYFVTVKPLTDDNGTILGVEDIGLKVYEKPSNNIKKGLDLEGGTRVLLEPEEEISPEDLDLVLANINQRLNVFGLSDITVRTANDFFGNTFISVEIAGVNEEEVKNLLTQQGKFEAKIGNETVFRGGNNDVIFVCRTADCAFVDDAGCGNLGNEWSCNFRFSITLSQKAADKQAEVTRNVPVEALGLGGQTYLTENLTLMLDDAVVNELRISSGLKGNPVTDIQISGSGQGSTKKEAREAALTDMKQLQTVLITGSLPVKLRIEKTDTISPLLGDGFLKNAVFAGLLSILAVAIVLVIRYREIKIAIPIVITMLSEVIIILGFAALAGWQLEMAAIAAILIAVGSGVDDQIVITDETLGRRKKGRSEETINWKDRLKKAFFIIMASYFTLVVAMLPLLWAGAGLLQGFALTTIVGVTVGVLITRPAFAVILESLIDK